MRKNSKEIYKEILLDRELEAFPHKTLLMQCLDDIIKGHPNEYEALEKSMELVEHSPILSEYVANTIIEHSRKLMQTLNVTMEGWKQQIEELERQKQIYGEIRNKISKQIFNKPEEVN